MRFWDASAVSSLCGTEAHSASLRALAQADPDFVVWWGTRTECLSALARATRDARADVATQAGYRARLNIFASLWKEILPSDVVRMSADRLLFIHPLRAADALQLAAALEWRGDSTAAMEFVCLDRRLADAARKEGFAVLP